MLRNAASFLVSMQHLYAPKNEHFVIPWGVDLCHDYVQTN